MPRRKRPIGRKGSHPRLAQGARIDTERIIKSFRADSQAEPDDADASHVNVRIPALGLTRDDDVALPHSLQAPRKR